jgi:hypothetical protein
MRRRLLVVVAPLEEIDAIVPYEVDDPMFGGEAAAPNVGPQVLQRLGLADAGEGSMTASTISSARRAVLGLVSTHQARSSRNSSWKTEIRRFLPATPRDGLEA